MNRVGSAKIALEQATAALAEEGKDIRNDAVVLGSYGFFPFDDTVTLAASQCFAPECATSSINSRVFHVIF